MARTVDGERIPLIVICGPTASGKTSLAIDLADSLAAEIISADSRQVYRGMDIGTAKATAEERLRVPHHLIDIVDPDRNFTAADFIRLARKAIDEVHSQGRIPLVVGGTGLYIRALTDGLLPAPGADDELRRRLIAQEALEGEGTLHRRLQEIDPIAADRLSPRDTIRIVRALEVFSLTGRRISELQKEHSFGDNPYRILAFGLSPPREELYRAIDLRVESMMAAGLLDEVRALLAKGYGPHLKAMRTIGYRECLQHLAGELSLDETVAQIQQASRRYAKRQLTWFRKDKSIIWVDSFGESDKIQALIDNFIVQH